MRLRAIKAFRVLRVLKVFKVWSGLWLWSRLSVWLWLGLRFLLWLRLRFLLWLRLRFLRHIKVFRVLRGFRVGRRLGIRRLRGRRLRVRGLRGGIGLRIFDVFFCPYGEAATRGESHGFGEFVAFEAFAAEAVVFLHSVGHVVGHEREGVDIDSS